ncbi:2-hydroxychromene-2-carboxylate isomerase [Phenylobacterium sp. LH3H17]|uniref:2-hydroxychromene-2-carboxylate isomerase n=1 Tax=Phenylobacterium sp. LH3H17 TaxID=2903901 RepID=UPI0020C9E172|nr:2-hydroxychromene-2-carboxylate isomerase [Phenylobacterium sp. LH3H17]UTP40356.1 2-hydroxychromene-2-carboxylate isomerase [Phenylobacterium sp. LH3H17]
MIECFFDCSSPWTYLAFHNLQPLAKELGVEVTWRPILVGGIFNTVNPSVYEQRATPVPAKARYMGKDLQDWARHSGIAITFPPKVFPVNSVKAMRGCIWLAPQGKLVPFATKVFEAYWGDNLDISQDAVLSAICEAVGVDGQAFLAGIATPEIKEQLRLNTEEVMARGGFGSPTIFVGKDDMYFGNDRLPLIRAAVLARQAQTHDA